MAGYDFRDVINQLFINQKPEHSEVRSLQYPRCALIVGTTFIFICWSYNETQYQEV